ncbi:hypothetical protein MLD38_009077 [Melastoma candidum]|uniref:Uncharacterized protein n=1 Tax=Melastoma candidum TaxID=119954 RepID=A0ACB9RZF3_9MYRT|nr:hypothetical protein MLD38_009077 [Melastoma candidum]
MFFRCQACNSTSELLGWVKEVFQHCAPTWDRDALSRELDFVSRIFQGSEDPRGRKLFWKCEDLMEKMKGGLAEPAACRAILVFFQGRGSDGDSDGDSPKNMESREDKAVQESRMALDACDRELEDKAREVAELKLERQKKKQQIEELEKIVRLKQAEADMFQLKADEAKREAERMQRIVLAKSEKSEEDYASRYLKLRLTKAEAEKQYLLEKIKFQERIITPFPETSRGDSSQLMYSKIQDLLQNL